MVGTSVQHAQISESQPIEALLNLCLQKITYDDLFAIKNSGFELLLDRYYQQRQITVWEDPLTLIYPAVSYTYPAVFYIYATCNCLDPLCRHKIRYSI